MIVAAAATARAQEVRPDTTTRADTVTRSDSGTHTVKRGDTLWDLAHAYLGDAYLWPEIYRLNTDQIDDPHWIYPGEVLKLPGRAAPTLAVTPSNPERPGPEFNPVVRQPEEGPRRVAGPTIFRPVQRVNARRGAQSALAAPPRVPIGDVLRAPYFDRTNGPKGSGRLIVGADIPGIAIPAATTNYQLYDKVLMTPPDGSSGDAYSKYLAYEVGPLVEDVGSVIIPTAILRVVRAPRDGEAAVAEVLELYGKLDANTRVVRIDTAGAGANATPIAVAREAGRTTTVRVIYRPAELPSTDSFVLFDLNAEDGMHIGDEVEIFRPRQNRIGDEGIASPEVSIARAQVVRVTPFGTTARVTSQEQPAIREGESVRVTARMP